MPKHTLYFMDPPNLIFKEVDKDPTIGKQIFNESDDAVNQCFYSLRHGNDRDPLEEMDHWKLNMFDELDLPLLNNNTKGHERNQLIKMQMVVLGLINRNSEVDTDKCRIMCMALGITTAGMLFIISIYII